MKAYISIVLTEILALCCYCRVHPVNKDLADSGCEISGCSCDCHNSAYLDSTEVHNSANLNSSEVGILSMMQVSSNETLATEMNSDIWTTEIEMDFAKVRF